MHVTISDWQLNSLNGEMLWESEIEEIGEPPVGTGGAARTRESAEKASKATIETGIQALGELELLMGYIAD